MNQNNTEKKRPKDKEARDRVLCPHKSFLVRAPAGSGKTTLLVDRYLKLLEMLMKEEGRGPENILCLTFTRKAAGEMRKRIQERIQESQLVKDKGIGNRINVQTIDSFQRALACTDSLRAHIMPHFQTTGKRDYLHRAVHRAVDESTKEIEGIGKNVSQYFNKRQIQNKMVRMLEKRDQWSDAADEIKGVKEGKKVLAALGEITNELDRIYSKERDYDYIAVSQAATRLVKGLGSPRCLKSVLGDPILHILVDEFQDVSAAQYEFFKALVKGWEKDETRTFFAVGDTMQSIYRFRGAGTEVILNMFEDNGGTAKSGNLKPKLGNLELELVELTVNFRSAKSVVDGVYKLLMRNSDPDRGKGEARLLKADVRKENGKGEFGVRWFETEDEEAKWVAKQMDDWIGRIKKSNRQCNGNDQNGELAVLVRARRYFTELIQPKLKQENLKHIDVNFAPLNRLACVNDLCTLARCIEDPNDKVASLALLRSPLLAMTSKDLHWLYTEGVPGSSGEEGRTPLRKLVDEYGDWEGVICKYSDHLESLKSDDAKKKKENFKNTIENFTTTFWRAQAEKTRMPVRSWLERAWFRMGGGAIYRGDADKQNVEQFLDLLEEVSGGSRSCNWRELDRLLKRLRGVSVCPEGKVKVMTIHAAKGLEFNEVIVPFLHRKGQDSKRDLVMIGQDKINGEQSDYIKLRLQESARDLEELRRLLYVAVTRAKSRCWLTLTKPKEQKNFENLSMIKQVVDGYKSTNQENQNSKDKGELMVHVDKNERPPENEDPKIGWESLKSLLECRGVSLCRGVSQTNGALSTENGDEGGFLRVTEFSKLRTKYKEHTQALCSDVDLVRDRKLNHLSKKSQEEAVEGGKEKGEEGMKRAIGIVVHEEIERVLMCSEWPGEDLSKYKGEMWDLQCRRDLMGAGAKANDVDDGAEEVWKHLEEVCSDGYMKKLWELNNEEHSGWNLDFEQVFFVDEKQEKRPEEVTKRPDLLVSNADKKKCLVIDFKTGEGSKEDGEQVEGYVDIVEKSLPGFDVEGALYYTSASKLVPAGQEEFGNIVQDIFRGS